MGAKRAASKSWQRLLRAGSWGGFVWTERVEDGRVRYAMAGLGLGLLVGSLLSTVGPVPIHWIGLRVAPIAFLGFVVPLCMFVIAAVHLQASRTDWEWRRRGVIARIRSERS